MASINPLLNTAAVAVSVAAFTTNHLCEHDEQHQPHMDIEGPTQILPRPPNNAGMGVEEDIDIQQPTGMHINDDAAAGSIDGGGDGDDDVETLSSAMSRVRVSVPKHISFGRRGRGRGHRW
jgi:hypothetical protein